MFPCGSGYARCKLVSDRPQVAWNKQKKIFDMTEFWMHSNTVNQPHQY